MRVPKFHPEVLFDAIGKLVPRSVLAETVKSIVDKSFVPDPKLQPILIQLLKSDEIFTNVVTTIAQHVERGHIYLVSKDFFDVFKETGLANVQFKHLPQDQAGYVELPYPIIDSDGDTLSGFYFANRLHPGYRRLTVGWENDCGACGAFHFAVEDNESGMDLIMEEKFNASGKEVHFTMPGFGPREEKSSYKPHMAVMINLLVYLASGQPDLRQFRNEIRTRTPTSTKPVRADSELSRSDITLVGFGYKKEAVRECEGWYSKPHMAWRRCGPNFSQLKWTFISGSEKKWRHDENE